jgi:ATP-dependent DNA helicase RecG
MSPTEIEEMMAQRASTDYSRRPAPSAAKLDQSATENFLEAYRRRVPRHAALPDRDLLRRTGVVLDDGKVTLAGCLLLGEQPEAFVGAADVAFRRDDDPDAPPGARARGEHFRGTIGQLFDDVSAAIYRELKTFQVERAGTLVDESDVPREAIREVLSNALVHRSFTPAMEPASIEVIVTDSEIEVKSPGGLHLGAEPATLGLPGSVAPLRNITLVNIAEMLTTPLGARLVEHQGSGIAAADRACHSAGTMPALFVDWPASLQVILLRGRLDEASASQLVAASGLPSDHNYVRLVAVAARLKQLREDGVGHPVGSTVFDARLAARALSPCSLEDAASAVRTLEDAGVFERRGAGRTPTWMISTPAMAPTPKRADATSNRIPELLAAIDAAPGGELAPHAIAEHLQLSSPNSRNRWIRRAVDQGLIEATNERLNASNQTYRLTATGRGKLNSQRRTP